jgi:enoyl-CoA hydratase
MASKPALASSHIKRLVRLSAQAPLDEGLALERTLFLDLMVSDEGHDLMARMNDQNLDIRRV